MMMILRAKLYDDDDVHYYICQRLKLEVYDDVDDVYPRCLFFLRNVVLFFCE